MRFAFYIILLEAALGCTTSTVQQEPIATRPVRAAVDSVPRSDLGSSRSSAAQLFHSGTVVYDYRTISIARATAGDTVPRADTTTVTALVSATFKALVTEDLTIQAQIRADSIVVRTGSIMPALIAPQVDTLRISTTSGKVSRIASQKRECDVHVQEAFARIDDVVPVLPTVQSGTWSDTLVQQVCRAGIQFQARRITTYHLDSTAIEFQLLRSTKTTFSGRGFQWNQPVESTGESTSTDTLSLDLTSRRRIQQIRGVTHLQLNFRSQLRNQQFEQSTQLLVQLR